MSLKSHYQEICTIFFWRLHRAWANMGFVDFVSSKYIYGKNLYPTYTNDICRNADSFKSWPLVFPKEKNQRMKSETMEVF